MNIGINARFLFSEILEGVGRYTWETTKRMIQNHPGDHFFLFFDRPYPKKYIIADNVTPIVVSPPARHPLLFYIWFEHRLPKLIEKYDIDVFYSADNFLSLRSEVPTLLVIHDLAYLHYPEHIRWAHRKYYRHFTPRFLNKAGHIITVSNYVKQDLITQFSINENRISVAYNALPERTNTLYVKKPILDKYFLYVGSLNPRKNISNLIQAFNDLEKQSDIKLVLIGTPYNLKKGTQRLIELGKRDKNIIHLTGISDDELMSYIEHAEALAYPSYFEGFGIPIIEAMALGTPVITSNVSSMPEVAGGAAILIDPNSVSELKEAMYMILEDKELVANKVELGYERVKYFSWDDTSSIIYNQLHQLHNTK